MRRKDKTEGKGKLRWEREEREREVGQGRRGRSDQTHLVRLSLTS